MGVRSMDARGRDVLRNLAGFRQIYHFRAQSEHDNRHMQLFERCVS